MHVTSLDHFVLTVADIATTTQFYVDVLGMTAQSFTAADGTTRHALMFGQAKINLHQRRKEFEPKAKAPTPGSADLCFLSDVSLAHWSHHLETHGTPIEQGPVARTGATGPLLSIYLRDPDGNLIEIANPQRSNQGA